MIRHGHANGLQRYHCRGKNGRSDAPQIVVGLAVTRDDFQVRHWVFPGNTVDVTTVAKVKEDLKGWQLTRGLFVGDAGMVSQANFQALAKGGGKYLMAMPMRRGDEITEVVLSRPGRYRNVAENLEVKEVIVGEGERRRRYAVCFNPPGAKRQKAHRETLIKELEAKLASLADQSKGYSKRACALRTSARYGRLRKETPKGLAIGRRAITELERFDGKFVVHSNDDSLTAEDMALGYKQQQRVEEARRPLRVLEHRDDWPRLLGVLGWIAAHPRPNVYLRQIDVPDVHSKFIERHRTLLAELLELILPPDAIDVTAPWGVDGFEQRFGFRPRPALIRFRLLDVTLHRLTGLSDLTLLAGEFAGLAPPQRRVFITENEINFLAFPRLPDSLVIFGAGYGFDSLAEARWLADRDLHYWGDLV